MQINAEETFETVLKSAVQVPFVHIDRRGFLRDELCKHCSREKTKKAVNETPAAAGIGVDAINMIADGCIDFETKKVTAISFVSGLPGGLAILGTVPADIAQFYGHVIRILQKLAYLYGWPELFDGDFALDDDEFNLLTLFLGVMFDVDGAEDALAEIAADAGGKTGKELAASASAAGVMGPIVNRITNLLGGKLAAEVVERGVGRLFPLIGGVVSGGITYATYKPMARKLKWLLADLPLAGPEQ
jgi:hypothetical protein